MRQRVKGDVIDFSLQTIFFFCVYFCYQPFFFFCTNALLLYLFNYFSGCNYVKYTNLYGVHDNLEDLHSKAVVDPQSLVVQMAEGGKKEMRNN